MAHRTPRRWIAAASACALSGVVLAAQANADSVADFYKGKDIKIIVGGTAEGGYAPYARMLQRHMGQFVPGNPTVITQFMPGGGGLVAATMSTMPRQRTAR